VSSTRCEAASCAIATKSMAKSYRDVVCAVSANPEAAVVTAPGRISLHERSIVSGDNPSDGDFVTVRRKKRVTPSPVGTAAVADITKNPGLP
jgi:hypothetical protein